MDRADIKRFQVSICRSAVRKGLKRSLPTIFSRKRILMSMITWRLSVAN